MQDDVPCYARLFENVPTLEATALNPGKTKPSRHSLMQLCARAEAIFESKTSTRSSSSIDTSSTDM
ncbi:hypothetical protein GN244_ATG03940 [Phytophthora infestans]|uniref:Uncharacterized protein n=1 Tax=Phytophthora infestans TaxID=4787 RepID=A0A833WK35_PHYIN|nr:hypothetical protein GN244_ATG03940 [Phytophthora infestans]KAF4150150.1 hypothetical protein GN958_ATG00776 [Phytophthora infestans]